MLVTPAEYARRRKVTRQAVNGQIRAGTVEVNADGLIDTDQADAAWPMAKAQSMPRSGRPKGRRRKARPSTNGHAAETYVNSRALNAAYSARLARLKYQREMDEVVSADEARAAAFNTGRRARELFMAMPDRMAASLEGRTAQEIHTLLEEEVRRICEEVARWARL